MRAVYISGTVDLSELENTDSGRELTQKIDAYYDWYETLDFVRKEIDFEQALQEIIVSSAEDVEALPTRGKLGVAIIMEGLLDFAAGAKARHRELMSAVLGLTGTSWYEMEDHSPEEFLRLKYGEMPFLEALLLYIDDIENFKNRDFKNTGGFFYKQFGIPESLETLKTKAQNGQIAEHEISALLVPASELFFFEVFFDYQDRYGEEVAGELREELKVWLEKKTPNEKWELFLQITEKDFKDGIKSGLADRRFSKGQCLRIFDERSTHYPPQNIIDQFQAFPRLVQRELIQKVSSRPNISEEAKSLLTEEIGEFHFEFPLSRESYRSSFFQLFDFQLDAFRKASLEFFDMDEQDLSLYFLISQMMGFGHDQDESNVLQRGVAGLCSEILEDGFSSYTFPGTEIIKLSHSMVYATPAYVRQTLYHEMGHQFEVLLEGLDQNLRQSFEESKSCLQNRQDKISGRGEFYLSEDFADLIVATFLEDTSSRPLFCDVFVKAENDFYDLETIVYDQASGAYATLRVSAPSLLNPDGEDDHSSNLLRALFNSVDRGMGLPDSCQATLEEAGHGDFQEWQCSLF